MKDIFYVKDERKSAVEIVVDKIKMLLIEKKLKPGDMIPNETVLAENLKVSRGSIREAMKILSAYGVIEIKRGAGTFISKSNNQKLFDPLLFNILVNSTDYHELIEVRDIMEKEVVRLFLHNALDEELQQLDAIMKKFNEAIENTNEPYEKRNKLGNELDLAYHKLLGALTHNTIVEKIYHFIIELFAPTISSIGGHSAHRDLHEALMQRDLEKAIAMVELHTEAWRTCWENRNGKRKEEQNTN